jgi:uncharacterized protein (DUF427 family)
VARRVGVDVGAERDDAPERAVLDLELLVDAALGLRRAAVAGDDELAAADLEPTSSGSMPARSAGRPRAAGRRVVDVDRGREAAARRGARPRVEDVAEQLVHLAAHALEVGEEVPLLAAPYFDRLDRWLDEDEEVHAHLRDPYHRVDARRSSRNVVVRAGGRVVAETDRPVVVSETGLPNRFYVPMRDVADDVLEPTATETVCPYKGVASYFRVRAGGTVVEDAAWSYEQPLEDAAKIAGLVAFFPDKVDVQAS